MRVVGVIFILEVKLTGRLANLLFCNKLAPIMEIRKLSLLLFLLQSAVVMNSQDVVKRTHLGISVTPQFSLQPMGSSEINMDKYNFCFSIGGDLLYDLSDAVQLKSGLYFQHTHINYRDYSPQFPSDVEDGEALIYKSYYDYDLNQYFVGLPVECRLKLGNLENANHFFLSGGCRFQYLLKTTGTVQLIESGIPWEEEELDQENFESGSIWSLLTLGFGYEWQIGKGKLAVNPVIDYSLTKMYNVYDFLPDYGSLQFYGIRLMYY